MSIFCKYKFFVCKCGTSTAFDMEGYKPCWKCEICGSSLGGPSESHKFVLKLDGTDGPYLLCKVCGEAVDISKHWQEN